ncbi:hypothetical protein KKH36_00785 [Patescibacteria group bacterium]|nr:hypothetical protein [Patescibacteria group bacterium]
MKFSQGWIFHKNNPLKKHRVFQPTILSQSWSSNKDEVVKNHFKTFVDWFFSKDIKVVIISLAVATVISLILLTLECFGVGWDQMIDSLLRQSYFLK